MNIHEELNIIFGKIQDENNIPNGKGYFIGTGEEPIFVVYLPYEDNPTARAENKIAEVTYRLKVDIIAREGNSYTTAEKTIKKILKDFNYDYQNGDSFVEEDEPYDYHRVLYFNKKVYTFDDEEY